MLFEYFSHALITFLEFLEYFLHLTKFTYNEFGYFYEFKQNPYRFWFNFKV